MRSNRALSTVVALVAGLVALAPAHAGAAPTEGGREWRELFETTGLSRAQVASVCPTDGVTPCSGSVGGKNLTGWVWATDAQVLDLMDDHAPGLSATNPVVSGIDGFWAAISFLGVMRWTTYTSTTYSYSEWTGGWTSSTDAAGLPVGGGAGYSHAMTGSTAGGSIGLGSDSGAASPYRGVFLWRTAGVDHSPPVITPSVVGTLGSNGWYRSDVSVSFTVTDPESAIVSSSGCDPSTVALDTAAATFTCTATSAGLGGAASASATVKRDVTPPTVVCGSSPTFTLGESASVTATVTDALAGPVATSVGVQVPTSAVGVRTALVSGADRAGNVATAACTYTVTAPTCNGKRVTIMGTPGNDAIVGTAKADVIHGLTGADSIDGGGGNDTICGGDGNDTVNGGKGNDVIDGGDGDDDLNGGDGIDDLRGGSGLDSIRGDGGADRCTSGETRMSSCAVVY